jgi:hypothetical protein
MLEEHLMYIHYFENSLIEKEDIQEGMNIGIAMSPSDETKVLVEVDRYVDVTSEAREFAQNNMRTLKAEAHVFPSLGNRILFNLFIRLRKNDHPLRAFPTFDKAYAWLSDI